MGNKLTTQKKQELRAIAGSLLPGYWFANGKLSGAVIHTAEWMELLADFKKKKINVIDDPKKMYNVKNLHRYEVDHYKKLETAYIVHGRKGVITYMLKYLREGTYKVRLKEEQRGKMGKRTTHKLMHGVCKVRFTLTTGKSFKN